MPVKINRNESSWHKIGFFDSFRPCAWVLSTKVQRNMLLKNIIEQNNKNSKFKYIVVFRFKSSTLEIFDRQIPKARCARKFWKVGAQNEVAGERADLVRFFPEKSPDFSRKSKIIFFVRKEMTYHNFFQQLIRKQNFLSTHVGFIKIEQCFSHERYQSLLSKLGHARWMWDKLP